MTTDFLSLWYPALGADADSSNLVALSKSVDASLEALLRTLCDANGNGILSGGTISIGAGLSVNITALKAVLEWSFCESIAANLASLPDNEATVYIYAVHTALPNASKAVTYEANTTGTPPTRGVLIATCTTAAGAVTAVVPNPVGRPKQIGNDLLQLPMEPAADLGAAGLIAIMQVDTNAQGVGAPLVMGADGHWDTADADATSTAPCGALALENGTGRKKVLLLGIIRNDAWNWTTGPGLVGLIYLSTATGTLTQTQPNGPDDVIQPVGFALSDDAMYFNPMTLFLTHV